MSLETRLTKLEQSNRRLQAMIACLAIMLLASILFSGQLLRPTDVSAQSGKKTLEANELIIRNLNGDSVVVLRGDGRGGGNSGIQVHGNNSAIECFDEADRKTVSIGVTTGDIGYKGSLTKVK